MSAVNRAMPKVEQTLASYMSRLRGIVLEGSGRVLGAGQAGACLHIMSVLQAYQADLLKELDEREQVSSDDIASSGGPLFVSPRH